MKIEASIQSIQGTSQTNRTLVQALLLMLQCISWIIAYYIYIKHKKCYNITINNSINLDTSILAIRNNTDSTERHFFVTIVLVWVKMLETGYSAPGSGIGLTNNLFILKELYKRTLARKSVTSALSH